MMVPPPSLNEIEELTICGKCNGAFNDSDQIPKVLECKHYFCLQCIRSKFGKTEATNNNEVFCHYCWKLTVLGEGGAEALRTSAPHLSLTKYLPNIELGSKGVNGEHTQSISHKEELSLLSKNGNSQPMSKALWCLSCGAECTANQDHSGHIVESETEARNHLVSEMRMEVVAMKELIAQIQHLATQQSKFLLQVLDSCIRLKTHLEVALQNSWAGTSETDNTKEIINRIRDALILAETPQQVYQLSPELVREKEKLQMKFEEMSLQCRLDNLIRNYEGVFDFVQIKQALQRVHAGETPVPSNNMETTQLDPILFLTNYCMSQLYSTHVLSKQHHQMNGIEQYPSEVELLRVPLPPLEVQSRPVVIAPRSDLLLEHINGQDVPPFQDSLSVAQVYTPQVQSFHAEPTEAQPQKKMPIQVGPIDSAPAQQVSLPASSIPSKKQQLDTTRKPPVQPDSAAKPREANHVQATAPVSTKSLIPMSKIVAAAPAQNQNSTAAMTRISRPVSHIYPRFSFTIEINGINQGKFVIETRPDAAPKMSENFQSLCNPGKKRSYKGCTFFKCFEGESVITGDFESNNGRGNRSVLHKEGFFVPDNTVLPAVRGAVGMRRTKIKQDSLGKVGSQFRIILKEINFTGIFGHVVDGIELIDKISNFGDENGTPSKRVVIATCGRI